MKKINLLTGNWTDQEWKNRLAFRFNSENIPIYSQKQLEITKVDNSQYLSNLQLRVDDSIFTLDWRHWTYDDDTFDDYIEKISLVQPKIIALFEYPFGIEMPKKVDAIQYFNKMIERTKKACIKIKEKNKNAIILSPAITVIEEDTEHNYIDYFIQTQQFFDGYAVHCVNNMTEHTLGKLSSLLNRILSVSSKKIWVTKRAVPCFDGKVINSSMIGELGWEPYNTKSAVSCLQRSFSIIESLSKGNTTWFYNGTCKDKYKPRTNPTPSEYWNYNSFPFIPNDFSYSWQYWHFLGLMTADGIIKEGLVSSLISLAESNV